MKTDEETTIVGCAKAGLFDTDVGPEALLRNCEHCKAGIWVHPMTFKNVTGPKVLLCSECADRKFEESPGSWIHPKQEMALLEALIVSLGNARNAKN